MKSTPWDVSCDEQGLFDEAHTNAVALGRPFEDYEAFGAIWERAHLELVPQMDSRFALYREAAGKVRRLWVVRDIVYCRQLGLAFFYRHAWCGTPRGDDRAVPVEDIGINGTCADCGGSLFQRPLARKE